MSRFCRCQIARIYFYQLHYVCRVGVNIGTREKSSCPSIPPRSACVLKREENQFEEKLHQFLSLIHHKPQWHSIKMPTTTITNKLLHEEWFNLNYVLNRAYYAFLLTPSSWIRRPNGFNCMTWTYKLVGVSVPLFSTFGIWLFVLTETLKGFSIYGNKGRIAYIYTRIYNRSSNCVWSAIWFVVWRAR